MGVAVALAEFEAGHVAQGRMVGHAGRNAQVERGGDERQCTALTAALGNHVPAVPFGQRSEQVGRTHAGEVDALHVVVVAVVEPVGQIAVAAAVESGADFAETLLGQVGVQAVDLELEPDAALLGVVLMAQGFLDGLDAGARRHEHGRAAPGPGVLGHEQITVDALSLLVELQFDEVAVDFVGAVFLRPLFRIAQGESGGFLLAVLPELTEIGGHGGIGFDFLGREPDLDMVPGGLPADGG